MVRDMGVALDWLCDLAVKNKWEVLKLNFGLGKSMLVGVHPDVMKVMLKSGRWVELGE